ncbi:hypothetical protein HGRIS_005012 [Hohenbuehelia grisea]|uniref:Uncharacterized protein n=1 Tax=Hohenbuehelia grisea TaxID=104357 RepID=A0ABR3JEC3_9AGAR
MDGTTYVLNSDGFSESGKTCDAPHKLQMPAATRSISCGRVHSNTLDANGHIWTFLNFGRPFKLSSPLLDGSSRDSSPLQIECGWSFSSVLTQGGDVFVWFPFAGNMAALIENKYREMDQQGDKKAKSVDGVIPCITWELSMDPFRLPSLPSLPKLSNSGSAENEPRLIKIAALDQHIIGLTNQGHVLKYGSLQDETKAVRGRWEYLPNFSEAKRVREHPVFAPDAGSETDKRIDAPTDMQITHISAHFRHFVAYSTGSSSIVLIGETDAGPQGQPRIDPEGQPQIIPALQNRSVISVVLGDYHYGALTASGELFTWGAYSKGALGLGDPATLPIGAPGGFANEAQLQQAVDRNHGIPPDVKEPTLVSFDQDKSKPRKRFCFSVAASGWHMGALAFDLEPNPDGDDSDSGAEVSNDPEGRDTHGSYPVPLPQPPFTSHGPGQVPILPLSSVFRVGLAGRDASQQGSSSSSGHHNQPM